MAAVWGNLVFLDYLFNEKIGVSGSGKVLETLIAENKANRCIAYTNPVSASTYPKPHVRYFKAV